MKALLLIALLSWFNGGKPACDDVNLSPPMMYDALIELSTDAPCDLDDGKKEC
jgi:hypothetical protein